MARKFRSPGKQLKAFGQTPPPEAPPDSPQSSPRLQRNARRIWLAGRLQMLNLTLFTFFAMMGYVQYFLHGAPAEQSLYIGIGFTAIVCLYAYIITLRRKR